MNPYQLWGLLIALSAIANLPVAIHLFTQRTKPMPIIPEFQAAIDSLNAAVADVQALKSAASSAPAAQDLTDTAAAVQAAADAVKAATGQ